MYYFTYNRDLTLFVPTNWQSVVHYTSAVFVLMSRIYITTNFTPRPPTLTSVILLSVYCTLTVFSFLVWNF